MGILRTFVARKIHYMRLHEMIRDNYPEYYSIERYPATETICIRKTQEEWGVLGNFAPTPIIVNGVVFDCTERIFHILKLRHDAEVLQEMMAQPGGMRIKMFVKHLNKTRPELFHDHWPQMIVDAMKFCLMQKYEQSEVFHQELARSSGKFIVEDETARKRGRDADTWGAVLSGDEYVGPNLLGRLLMELRDNGQLEYHLPDDALDFINHLK
jgi:ribA/ribD-fused uncharacterized protein